MSDDDIRITARGQPLGDGATLSESLRALVDDGQLPPDLAAQTQAELDADGDLVAFSKYLMAELRRRGEVPL